MMKGDRQTGCWKIGSAESKKLMPPIFEGITPMTEVFEIINDLKFESCPILLGIVPFTRGESDIFNPNREESLVISEGMGPKRPGFS